MIAGSTRPDRFGLASKDSNASFVGEVRLKVVRGGGGDRPCVELVLWMPLGLQRISDRLDCDRVRSLVRPVSAADWRCWPDGDARTGAKSPTARSGLGEGFSFARPGLFRSFAHSDHAFLTARWPGCLPAGSGADQHRATIAFAARQHRPDAARYVCSPRSVAICSGSIAGRKVCKFLSRTPSFCRRGLPGWLAGYGRPHGHFAIRSFLRDQRELPSPSTRFLDTVKMSQAAMNMAAMTGPITNPLRPNVAIPPSVEISTT